MSRFKSNCSVMLVEPSWLAEVIWFTAAIRPNWRSRGVATADAMVCGSAPGKPAPTLITGKSTLGSEATGRKLKARMPDISSATASSDVPIGRRINGDEILIVQMQNQSTQNQSADTGSLRGIGLPMAYRENRCASRSNHK